MRTACLHASEANILQFERAAAEAGLDPRQLKHHVRPDLVAFGQASMADAAALVTRGREPLTVPVAAIRTVISATPSP